MTRQTARGRLRRDYSPQAAAQARTIQQMAQAESERQRQRRADDMAILAAFVQATPVAPQADPSEE